MATNTEKIVVKVIVEGQKNLDKLGKSTKKATSNVGSLSKSLLKMTGGLLAASTAFRAISSVISSTIKTFTKFEFEMAKVKAITGSTDKDFLKLSVTAQQLGKSTFFTASQVAELQVNFGKLGFSTQEILNAQEATLLLATATQSDLGRAAIVAGATVRGFGLDASETARVVDVMAVAFTSSALDIEKFQTSMTKVAPISAAANISLEATTAVMGTLTDAGIEASIAGTSLRNIFLKLADPTSDLSKHLGFTVNSSEDLEKALLKLNSESLTNAEMMELVDLRQVAAFATMVRGVGNIQELTSSFKEATGSAQEFSDIMADTLQGDILKAKSAWQGFQIAIMEGTGVINKELRKLLQGFSLITNRLADDQKNAQQRSVDIFTEQIKIAKLQKKELKEINDIDTKLVDGIQTRINDLQKENEKRENSSPFLDPKKEKVKQKEIEATKLAIVALTEEILRLNKAEIDNTEQAKLNADIEKEKEKRAKQNKAKRDADDLLKKQKEQEIANRKAERLLLEKFKKAQELEKIAFEELENKEKEDLKNKIITKEEFDLNMFNLELNHLENMKNINIQYGENIAFINGEILDIELNRIATVAAAEAKAQEKIKQDKLDAKTDRENQIKDVDQLGKSLITMAGQEQKLQGVKKLGIKLTAAATLATNLETIANAKLAIAKAATEPFPASLIAIVTVLASMLSAAQSAKTITTFADGGMVHGNSHAQGGEKFAVGGRVVELEGGEAVINKRSTSMFKGQLSAMNAAGGGVKFADGGLMNMPSFAQSQFSATGQAGMMGAIGQGGKVVVVESDISTVQNTVSVIEAEATI